MFETAAIRDRVQRSTRSLCTIALASAASLFVPPNLAVHAQATANSNKAAAVVESGVPTAPQIVDRYLAAIGGRAAWEKIHSRTSLGRIQIPGMNLSGTVMVHEKAPNKTLLVVILSGAAFRQAYDGKIGWSDDPTNGLRVQSGDELAQVERDADFYHPLDLEKLYLKLSVAGIENVNGHDAFVVEGTIPDGGVDKMYFDRQTGLVVRVSGKRYANGAPADFREDLGDFRDVDGVKLPFFLEQKTGDSSFTIQIDEVHHNVDLDDSEFAKPAS
jgi:zinc protease